MPRSRSNRALASAWIPRTEPFDGGRSRRQADDDLGSSPFQAERDGGRSRRVKPGRSGDGGSRKPTRRSAGPGRRFSERKDHPSAHPHRLEPGDLLLQHGGHERLEGGVRAAQPDTSQPPREVGQDADARGGTRSHRRLADQVRGVLECPVGAGPPGLDLDLVAELAQVLGRRALRRQGRAQDLEAAADADGRVPGPVAERRERGGEVQWSSRTEAAGRRWVIRRLRPRFVRPAHFAGSDPSVARPPRCRPGHARRLGRDCSRWAARRLRLRWAR